MIRAKHATLGFLASLVFTAPAISGPPSAPWFPKAPALPNPEGNAIRVTTVEELFEAVETVPSGGTILIADGRYRMPRYLEVSTDNVTLRGESGSRDRVVLDGATSRHGELLGITGCEGVTIADLTIENMKWNGFKINSNLGATKVTIYNCVIHNIWQRGVKGPAVPKGREADLSPRDCRIRFCLFYNDRPKRFSDDETDTPGTFKGNYVGGIDMMGAEGLQIADNVFVGIRGRTREGRGSVFLWRNSRRCVVERNIFLNCDVGIALGNPSRSHEPIHDTGCVVRDNLIVQCPETSILACYTKDCRIERNTIFESPSKWGRLVWVLRDNEGLKVKDNLLVGAPVRVNSESRIAESGNEVRKTLEEAKGRGQAEVQRALEWIAVHQEEEKQAAEVQVESRSLGPDVIAAMRKVHAEFKGTEGYVAQFGDSITYSMAFWSPMDWDDPSRFLTEDDGLPKSLPDQRWRDYIKGARDKGANFANYSGWKAKRLLEAVGPVLEREKPVAAVIMIGTNDISGGKVPESYPRDLEAVVRKCLAAHCVPILSTIPPRRGRDEAVAAANTIIRELASRHHLPLVDFHAACLRHRPGDTWDGTIISKDGVHPSGGKTNDYSPGNLKVCGYALRNWVTFLAVRELVFEVFS